LLSLIPPSFTCVEPPSHPRLTRLTHTTLPKTNQTTTASIFGVGAALAVFYHRHRRELGERAEGALRSLGACLLLNLAYAAFNKRVDTWGHLGGALGGAVTGWLLGPRLVAVAVGGGGEGEGKARRDDGGGGGLGVGPSRRRRAVVRLEDRPPVGWLAGTGGYVGRVVAAGGARRRAEEDRGGRRQGGGGRGEG
jgi:hypothetical protein